MAHHLVSSQPAETVAWGRACSRVPSFEKRSLLATYFSFSFGECDTRRASTAHLLASVAFQLLSTDPARYSRIAGFHKVIMSLSTTLTQAALLVMFQFLLDTKEGENPLYLVVDGLHRADPSWRVFLEVLLAIFSNGRQPTCPVPRLQCQRCGEAGYPTSAGPWRASGVLPSPVLEGRVSY